MSVVSEGEPRWPRCGACDQLLPGWGTVLLARRCKQNAALRQSQLASPLSSPPPGGTAAPRSTGAGALPSSCSACRRRGPSARAEMRQLIDQPYVQVPADQIHYFAYRAHYQIDKSQTKVVDRFIQKEDSFAVNNKPPPAQRKKRKRNKGGNPSESYKLSRTEYLAEPIITDRKGKSFRKRPKPGKGESRSRDKGTFWNTLRKF